MLEHPLIAPAVAKEVHFFDNHFQRGAAWYWDQFPAESAITPGTITGEASPYYIFHPLAAKRAAELLPAARLIAILRDPVDRAFSHYQHERRRGKEPLSFRDALASEDERLRGEVKKIVETPGHRSVSHQFYSYRSRGCYIDQLEEWLRYFPRENLLILIAEHFYDAPGTIVQQVIDFLHLPALPSRPPASYEKHNLAEYPKLDAELRTELAAFYARYNQRLARFLGTDLPWQRADALFEQSPSR